MSKTPYVSRMDDTTEFDFNEILSEQSKGKEVIIKKMSIAIGILLLLEICKYFFWNFEGRN